ncbi:MAG: M64 family metallopeptidase [Phycisphaerales bacterium]|jgi:hypothetical protein|nr:M64 family metallopeptidase [Phycisphaerales bacterium]
MINVVTTGLVCSVAASLCAAGGQTERLYYDAVEAGGTLVGGVIEVPMVAHEHRHLGGRAVSTQIWGSGPSSNRVDLVVVGDGYIADELGLYATHASDVVGALFGIEPLATYGPCFLAHRVDVISNESGVDNDPTDGIDRDTAMDMGFFCYGIERLLCVNVSKAVGFAGAAPQQEQIIAIANSTKYGGAGYASSNLGTVSGGNGSAFDVAIHEFGHSMADLADEYHYGDGATYTGGETGAVNTSILTEAEMAASGTKWSEWLGENQPAWDGLVSTYEGAAYHEYGIYRPSNNSMMRSLARPFNLIAAEAFILEIYATIDPLDDHSPTDDPLNGDEVLYVDPIDLTGHALSVQWSIDGVPIPGATGATLDLSSVDLLGAIEVSVRVVDETPWVRDEAARASLMSRDLAWTIDLPCAGDLDGNGAVTVNDVLIVVGSFGQVGGAGDADGNGVVNANDLLVVLGGWGACP